MQNVTKITLHQGLITSTHQGFHAMVIRGQPKIENPNKNKGVKKWIKFFILKLIYSQKPLPNQSPSNNLDKFGCHLTIMRWWLKMPTNPYMAIKIHSHHLIATEFSWCGCMFTKFSRHATMVIKRFSITTMSYPSPQPLVFFPLLHFPPLMTIEILCDLFIKKSGH